MKDKEELIYDLIFSEELDYKIDISEYIKDIYKYEKFIQEIKDVLKKSEVTIIRDKVEVNTKTAIWNLKVKK
jgi:hypothetical protein